MSREEYFGQGRTHRIVPPIAHRSLSKKQISESKRFKNEEEMERA